jgi:hypothetical protein
VGLPDERAGKRRDGKARRGGAVSAWSASSIPNTLHANSTIACFLLARCFAWREALTIVQPGTLLRCHREAFRLFWRWQSRPGRPRLPETLQRLITGMAQDNPSWGEERIAAEMLLKLGIRAAVRREGPIELVGRLQEVAPARVAEGVAVVGRLALVPSMK